MIKDIITISFPHDLSIDIFKGHLKTYFFARYLVHYRLRDCALHKLIITITIAPIIVVY